MNINNFKKRRAQVMQQLGTSGIAIIVSNQEPNQAYSAFPFQQNSDFYYLSGFDEPDSILVLAPNRTQGEYILFCRENKLAEEIWNGYRAGQEGARKIYGANQSFPITAFKDMLSDLIADYEAVYTNFGNDKAVDDLIFNTVSQMRSKRRCGSNPPTDIIHISKIVHEMRVCKDEEELALMRNAANIGMKAHLRAMKACRPGMYEYELEAELLHEYVRSGGLLAFGSIVGSGANTCILHYVYNNAQLKDGDLVLIDAGTKNQHYNSDITRTIPINGRFTNEQKAIYQAVLDTQLALIANMRPGVTWMEQQLLSERIITEKLLELGILRGNLETLIANQACKLFYMHNFGHMIGLDTHDVGVYKANNEWRKFMPGMVHTVEPGIYISDKIPNVDPKWLNIGVRIEDDVLITENGCEVLTKELPKTVAEIEEAMVHQSNY